MIGSLPGLTAPVTGGASRGCAPPLAGGCRPRAAERVRAGAHAGPVPARFAAYTRSGRARAAEVTAGRWGGGSMAASFWLRGAASGLRYWSRGQRPAAAGLAAGKDLALPSPVPPPAAPFSRPDGRRGLFTGGAAVESGLKRNILAGPRACRLLRLPLAPPVLPRSTPQCLPLVQVDGVQSPFRDLGRGGKTLG